MTGDIWIYGAIGTDERNQEISFDNVRQQIARNKAAEELTVHIISPGGDVPEGEAIYNALMNSGKKITTLIEGTCASIATLIAGAGSKILMNKAARFMIHNPQVTNINGPADARVLRNVATQLDQIKTLLINVYKKRTGLSQEELWALYDNETWMSAEEAAEKGFIDEAVDAIRAVAKVDLTKFTSEMKQETVLQNLLKRFQNALSSVKIKNEMIETLTDGTKVVVLSEDGDFTGKQVIYESGEPVPAGEHTLVSGKVLVVGDNGTITEVKEAAVDNTNKEDEMKKDEEIANLKAQLAEAQAKAEQAVAQVATAETKALKFENRVKAIEQDFIKLKEEALQTAGDREPVNNRGPVFKNMDNPAKDYDPMGEEVKTFLKGRNRI